MIKPDRVMNLEVDEGADLTQQYFKIDQSTGLPFDLTGYRAEVQVRTCYNGKQNLEVALSYSSDADEGITIYGAAGKVTLEIPYTDTMNKWWFRAVYDLYLISPTGKREKFFRGLFTILRSVTRLENTSLGDISGSETSPYTQPNNFDVGAVNKENP